MAPPRVIFGQCRYCARSASRRARIRRGVAHNVCDAHYRLWLRTGRFTQERHAVTTREAAQVLQLHRSRLTVRAIARELGLASTTVQRTIQRRAAGEKPGWNVRPR